MKMDRKFQNLQFFADAEDRPERRSAQRSSRLPGWLNGKVIALIAGGLALVVVLVILFSALSSGGSKFDMIDRELLLADLGERDSLHFYVGGKMLDTRQDTEDFNDWQVSMDGQVAWFLVEEKKDEEVLYVLNDEDILYVVENPQQILMSETGTALAYIAEDELFLYTVDKKSSENIAADVTNIFAISPDGKTVAYTDADGLCYIYNDGKTAELMEEVTVLSVSDGGKYIYCISEDEEGADCLYLYNTKGQIGLVASGVCVENAIFYTNKAHTQLIFQAEGKIGNRWYAVEKDELEENVHNLNSADNFKPLIPENAQICEEGSLRVLGVDSLTEMVYQSYDVDDATMKLVYVSNQWGTSTLVSKVTEAQIGATGEMIYYAKSDRLYSIEAVAGAQSTQLAADVQSFTVTSDGEGVYYLTEEGNAFYQKGSKAVKIGEFVEELTVTYDGYALFVSEGALYSADRSDKVKTVVADFVGGSVEAAADGTYYRIVEDDICIVYGASSGIKFERLAEEDVLPETPDNGNNNDNKTGV